MKELIARYKRHIEQLESMLKDELYSEIHQIPTVGNYILSAGGKRIRPLMMLIIASNNETVPEEAISSACAIEYIHTATLLHDDVVDNAKMRRGKPSANTIWHNQICVLVGDFLFAKSFNIMTRYLPKEALNVASEACIALAEGEILQLVRAFDVNTTIDDYYKIIYGKTAALFSAGCEIAGIISGKYSREALKEFGKEVGLAFQIKDDLLDLMGNPKEMGKERGNDLKEGKITLPLLLLKEKGHRSKIEEVVLKDKISEKDIEEIVTLCLTERILEETENIIRGHLKNAKKHLEETGFEEEKKKDLLRIVKFLEERSY